MRGGWGRMAIGWMVVLAGLFVSGGVAQTITDSNRPPVGLSEAQEKGGESVMATEIQEVLGRQMAAWNRGDLEAYMGAYWKSAKLSFSSGGKTTYGWQATLDNYKKGYAPPKQMGTLSFDQVEITPLGEEAALVLGRWRLRMKNEDDREGNFTLVMKKIESGWKIIHDHSSIQRKPESKPESKLKKSRKTERESGLPSVSATGEMP